MHILFLTDNFPPEVNAPASRTFEHCSEWVKAGHQVTVITSIPNFPCGKIFIGYKNKFWQSEVVAGIRVIRVWTYIAPNEGVIRRVFDYLTYMINSFLGSLFVKKVDVVIGTSPQFFTVCAAYAISVVKGIPWIFELRDIWPESIRVVGAIKKRKILAMVEAVELFLYKKADAIVSVTESFRISLGARGIDLKKIHVVTNGVDIGRFSPVAKDGSLLRQYSLQHKFVIGYIGTHGLAHALDVVLDAAKILKNCPGGDRFRFLLLGDGASKVDLHKRAKVEELDNVIFVDSVPKEEVVSYWSLLDASVIHLKKDALFEGVIPSKLFECMGMGIPILHGVEGESANIVEREQVGLLFEPENASDLINKIQMLSNDEILHARLKTNGPIAACCYNRATLAKKMLKIIEKFNQHNKL